MTGKVPGFSGCVVLVHVLVNTAVVKRGSLPNLLPLFCEAWLRRMCRWIELKWRKFHLKFTQPVSAAYSGGLLGDAGDARHYCVSCRSGTDLCYTRRDAT